MLAPLKYDYFGGDNMFTILTVVMISQVYNIYKKIKFYTLNMCSLSDLNSNSIKLLKYVIKSNMGSQLNPHTKQTERGF